MRVMPEAFLGMQTLATLNPQLLRGFHRRPSRWRAVLAVPWRILSCLWSMCSLLLLVGCDRSDVGAGVAIGVAAGCLVGVVCYRTAERIVSYYASIRLFAERAGETAQEANALAKQIRDNQVAMGGALNRVIQETMQLKGQMHAAGLCGCEDTEVVAVPGFAPPPKVKEPS